MTAFGNSSMTSLSQERFKDGTGQPRASDAYPDGLGGTESESEKAPDFGRFSGLFSREYTAKVVVPEIKGLTPEKGWWQESLENGAGERLLRIEKHRKRGQEVARFIREEIRFGKLADRVSECGSFLTFRHWVAPNLTKLHHANFCCKFILCTFCAAARACKYTAKFTEKITHVLKKWPNLRVAHVVLSTRNTDTLEEALDNILEAKKKMLQMRRNDKKCLSSSALSCVAGGVMVLEIKRSERGGKWHPHFHCIMLLEDKINQNDFWDEWRECTKICDVALPYLKEIGKSDARLIKGVSEVFKYTVKPGSLTPEETWEVFSAVDGCRQLISSFGCLRGVKIDEEDLAECSDDYWGPYLDFFLKAFGEEWRGQGCKSGVYDDLPLEGEEDYEIWDTALPWLPGKEKKARKKSS